MTGVDLHRVERAVTSIAFEAVEQLDARYDERRRIGMGEYTEEWHVMATGTLNTTTDFPQGLLTIEFSTDFFLAQEQRRSDLTMPTFHFGSYQGNPAKPVVMMHAAVRSWTKRLDAAFIGAVISVGAYNPGATPGSQFEALMHFSFSGWGAPFDPESGEAEGS